MSEHMHSRVYASKVEVGSEEHFLWWIGFHGKILLKASEKINLNEKA